MTALADLAARFGLTWTAVAWGVALFAVSAAGSLAVATAVLVRLPADYFAAEGPAIQHGGLPTRIAKNVLGALLVLVGVVLSIPGVPGQGVLTILLGVMLLDFPGKRALERRFVSAPSVRRAVNRLRARFGSPPLVLGAGPSPSSGVKT